MEDGVLKIGDRMMIFDGGNPLEGCPKSYEEADKWADDANADKVAFHEPKWSFVCGFKLDFDGPILDVSSRFYPPKTHYGPKWDGSVSILLLGKTIHEESFECDTLDQLREAVEKFVQEYAERLNVQPKNEADPNHAVGL